MIAAPPGWTQHFGAQLLSLYPPGGGGRIRYFERIRPLQRFSEVIRFVLSHDPQFRVSSLFDARPIVTSEGEYGAWVRVNGTRDGERAVHFIGAVFGDEFVAAVDAFVAVPASLPAIEDAARQLVVDTSLRLGVRRRRYLYDPPPGWRALSNGLVANWYPPEFPRDHVNIIVPPAEPLDPYAGDRAVPSHDFDAMLASDLARGWTVEGTVERADVVSSGGLVGRHNAVAMWRPNDNRLLHREFVTYVAPPYAYLMRMESFAFRDEHRRLLLAMARSAAPIPSSEARRIALARPAHTISHWID